MKKILLILTAFIVLAGCKKDDPKPCRPKPQKELTPDELKKLFRSKLISYNSIVTYEVTCETCEMEIPRWIKVHPFISVDGYEKYSYVVQDNKEAIITIYTASKKPIPFTYRLTIDGIKYMEVNASIVFGTPYYNTFYF